ADVAVDDPDGHEEHAESEFRLVFHFLLPPPLYHCGILFVIIPEDGEKGKHFSAQLDRAGPV
ncbi:MAG: hypothetical protein IIY43_07570, partial [Oscillospiraceae bacterium]|nr:hypothetical protein [Oscillospiraceae bacterium]